MAQKTVVLLSGGADSLVVAAVVADRYPEAMRYGVFVSYGQVSEKRERQAAKDIAKEYGMYLELVEMKLPFLDGHFLTGDPEDGIIFVPEMSSALGVPSRHGPRAHIIPYRNVMLVSVASAFAASVGAHELYVGFDKGPNTAADVTRAFQTTMNAALYESKEDTAVAIVAPLIEGGKVDTIRMGDELGVDWSKSWSCYNGLKLPCGVCSPCLARIEAFKELELEEGVEYHSLDFMKKLLGDE